MGSLAKAIEPKSDQLNADDLITGPITVTVTKVDINESAEQKVVIHYDGDHGKPYKPCKSMTRVMAEIWGGADNGRSFIGQSMTLYRDPRVKWGGLDVGGIRISHMTGIERDTPVVVTVTKGKRAPMIIHPLKLDNVRPVATTQEDKVARGVKALVARIAACGNHADLATMLAEDRIIEQRDYLKKERPELSATLEEAISAANPGSSLVATLIKRLDACKDADSAADVMADPDVDTLNADDAHTLMEAFRAKFGGA